MRRTGQTQAAVRRVVGVGAIGLLVLGAVAAKPVDKPAKVELCHAEGDGEFHAIAVSTNAERAHRDNHGDGMVGDPVPGMAGYTFDADCVPNRMPLVQAVSTDSDGNQRLIAELLDTNGDGVPSTGDTVRTAEYPRTTDGTDYGSFAVTEHVLDGDVTVVDNANPGVYYRRSVTGNSTTTCTNCYFRFHEIEFEETDGRRRRQSEQRYQEWGYSATGEHGNTSFTDYGMDCDVRCRSDRGSVQRNSASAPAEDLSFSSANTRDDFVDLIWNY